MPTLNINGKRVTVGDEFLSLSPDEQNSTVDEIAQSIGGGSAASQSLIQRATSPITSYPSTLGRHVQESLGELSTGLAEARPEAQRMATEAAQKGYSIPDYSLSGLGKALSSVGKTAAGAIGYVGAPISAATESVFSKPVGDITGIPPQYLQFAAGLYGPELAPSIINAATSAYRAVRPLKAVTPSTEELLASGASGLQSPEVQSARIYPRTTEEFYNTLPGVIRRDTGITQRGAPETMSTIEDFSKERPVSIDELRLQKQTLGNIIQKNIPSFGKQTNPDELRAASAARSAIDDMISNLQQKELISGNAPELASAYARANEEYSAGKQAELLDAKKFKAELKAAKANSGLNVGNQLRDQVFSIITNPKLAKQFNDAELAYMNRIVFGSPSENAARYIGDLGGGGGRLGNTVARYVGTSILGPAGAVLPEAATAIRSLANRMTLQNFDKLNAMVRSDTPLGRSLQNALVQWRRTNAAVGRGATSTSRAAASEKQLQDILDQVGVNLGPIPVPAENQQ